MKILELKFKNLNSLYGEWVIDLSSPEYTINGIFAITGPTGAGKSTTLDAICLALYGATPRLGKITKSSNEIMSGQTGECYAEVLFESQAGKFRCHWSQHRSRRKADGNLAEAKHEIADAVSGRILESKKRDVAKVIEEKTGMDFDRFTRSMLLAQGGFAAFLQADSGSRGPILEQITGTEVYSEISIRVFERQRDEHKKLELLKAETTGIRLLSETQEEELAEALAEKQKSEKEMTAQHKAINEAVQWLMGIEALKKEIGALTMESDTLLEKIERFKPDREKLNIAQKAAELEGDFTAVFSVRQQQVDDQKKLKANEDQIPPTKLVLAQKAELLKNAEQATAMLKEKQNAAIPLIKEVRSLDLKISEKKKDIFTGESDCKKTKHQIDDSQTRLKQVEAKRDVAQKEMGLVQDYLSANTRDEILVTQLAGITEQLNNLQAVSESIVQKKEAVQRSQKQAEECAKQLEKLLQELNVRKTAQDNADKQTLQKKEELSGLLGDRELLGYRAERDTLMREMVYLRRIADLETERKMLVDGKPCPLCGSVEHPFAQGNVPEMDDTEKRINSLSGLIQKAEQMEADVKNLEKKEKNAALKLVESEKKAAQANNEKDNTESTLKRLRDELSTVTERFVQLKTQTLSNLETFGITHISENDLKATISSLNDRFKAWQEHQQTKIRIEKQYNELLVEIKGINATIETLSQTLQEKHNTLDGIKKENSGLISARQALYGAKKPDEEESRLIKQVTDAEKEEKTRRVAKESAKQKVGEIETRIMSLKESLTKRSTELQDKENKFAVSLGKAGFSGEESFLACRLSIDERNRLSKTAKTLDEQQTEISARQKDRETRLNQELKKKLIEAALEDLKIIHAEIEGKLKIIGEEIGAIKQNLADNQNAKAQIKEKQILIDSQEKEYRRWFQLNAYIGSANGKKYGNFAQGLTFELMISHANRQLEKMTDRYLLVRDDNEPLELNVIDNYQAAEIRSTKNLSGGESFIVSLALALGLSKMAGRKVRVDSLFLDEGFGTLDEDALETALETLSGLQQTGKLIGIISHVPALKERIGTQINILPVSGGKSTLAGPGCRRIVLRVRK